jgi:hypothetical protein
MSGIQLNFFLKHYPFYDKTTNIYAGLFHILYFWTSIFFLIFAYIDYQEKGIIYVVSSIIILYFYFNLKYKIEENVFLDLTGREQMSIVQISLKEHKSERTISSTIRQIKLKMLKAFLPIMM